jgi:hypothetical protein
MKFVRQRKWLDVSSFCRGDRTQPNQSRDRTIFPHPNSKSDRASIFSPMYYKGLTWANILGIISPWENMPAYRVYTHYFKNTDYTD